MRSLECNAIVLNCLTNYFNEILIMQSFWPTIEDRRSRKYMIAYYHRILQQQHEIMKNWIG